ncbi:MAG: hypothetical protein LBL98_06290 [Ruminococcus sp.]|jgi:hypothetical protein|nr:hypothetical protein [Ruminococcus sp.]
MKNGILEQFKGAKSAEEIVGFFKGIGKEISIETAEKIFSAGDNPEAELTEAELEAITGGLRDFDGNLVIIYPGNYVCNSFNRAPNSRFNEKCCLTCSFLHEAFLYRYCNNPDFECGGNIFFS